MKSIYGVGFRYSSDHPLRVGISYVVRSGNTLVTYQDRKDGTPIDQAIDMVEDTPGVKVLGKVTTGDSETFLILDSRSYKLLLDAHDREEQQVHERAIEDWSKLPEEEQTNMDPWQAYVLYHQKKPSAEYMKARFGQEVTP